MIALLLSVSVLALLVAADLRRRSRMMADLAQLNALGQLKLDLAIAHQRLEEALSGEEREAESLVALFGSARRTAELLSGFSVDRTGEVPALELAYRSGAAVLARDVRSLEELAEVRLAASASGAVADAGSETDVGYDAAHAATMERASRIEETVRGHLRADTRQLRTVLVLAALWLFGSIAAAAAIGGREIRQRRAEEAQRESERALASLIAHLPGMAYRRRRGAHWPFEVLSPGIWGLTGRSPSDVIEGRVRFSSLVHPDDRAGVRQVVREAVAARRGYELAYRLFAADGGTRWVRDLGGPVLDESGRIIAIEGILLDESERRRLEAALRRSQQLEGLGKMARGLAHDLNNYLASIRANSELAIQARGDPEGSLASVVETADRMSALLQRVVAFGRKRERPERPTAVNPVLAAVARLLGETAPNVSIEVRLGEAIPGVLAATEEIEQVGMNLVVNALEALGSREEPAAARGGKVTIRTATVERARPGEGPSRAWVVVEVADDGPGIPEAVRATLFEPFVSTKSRSGGLGLAIVQEIVERHGGFVEVESDAGHGTSFRIHFPATDVPAPEEATPGEEPSAPGGDAICVLVVDDDSRYRETLASQLSGWGYRTLVAGGGIEALALLSRTGEVDVVLTDVGMPELDGPSLAARLQAEGSEHAVVFMSGHVAEVALPDGPRRVLGKPVSREDLARAIEERLSC